MSDRAVAQLNYFTTVLRQASSEIQNLPVHDVDSELTSFGAEVVVVLNDYANTASDTAAFLNEAQAFQQYSNSFEVGAESFLRGYLGDPLGKYNELNAQAGQYEQRRRRMAARIGEMERRWNQLEGRSIQLRGVLAARHDQEFSPLLNSTPVPTANQDSIASANQEDSPQPDESKPKRHGAIPKFFGFIYDYTGYTGVILMIVIIAGCYLADSSGKKC
ncbi:MAG: hypothetical protein N2C14_18160 [Planctomycetales bacterium]